MQLNDAEFDRVDAHYARQNLEAAILKGLVSAGKDPERLRAEDLQSMDEFHIRGRKATSDLARDVVLERHMQVLDVGSGLGGAARYLAREFGCRVTGLDLSAEYCRVATGLTERLGLERLVSFQQGNALALPYPDASFDIVWTQHASMNIADKSGLYREMWRVLKPGGKLAIYDILAGPGGAVYFPVPWAREPSTSFLLTPRQLLNRLSDIGFKPVVWRDVTRGGLEWFRQVQEKAGKAAPPSVGLHLLLGADFKRMALNQLLNLEGERISLIEAVFRRPFQRPQ